MFKDKNETYLYFTRNDDNKRNENEDIFLSVRKKNRWSKPFSFAYNTNNPESITYASKDFIIYYTHISDRARGSLYYSRKEKGQWSNSKPINTINTIGNFESDGILSSDGRVLLFVSDQPSGLGYTHAPKGNYYHGDYWGNTDIYVSIMNMNGNWEQPINLGSIVNTPFAERSPWLSNDGMTLYFSSDGHTGLGKLDVFKATRLDPTSWTEWSKPENLGIFINTNNDEYGYKIIEDSLVSAVFSSQRNKRHFDIGIVTLEKQNQPNEYGHTFTGTVTDSKGEPLRNVPIVAEDSDSGEKVGKSNTDDNGSFEIPIPKDTENISLYTPDERFLPKTQKPENLKKLSNPDKGHNKRYQSPHEILKDKSDQELDDAINKGLGGCIGNADSGSEGRKNYAKELNDNLDNGDSGLKEKLNQLGAETGYDGHYSEDNIAKAIMHIVRESPNSIYDEYIYKMGETIGTTRSIGDTIEHEVITDVKDSFQNLSETDIQNIINQDIANKMNGIGEEGLKQNIYAPANPLSLEQIANLRNDDGLMNELANLKRKEINKGDNRKKIPSLKTIAGYPQYFNDLTRVPLDTIVLFTPEELICDSSAISLNTIKFESKSWNLNKKSILELNRLVHYLKKHNYNIEVSGHTDTDSTHSYNLTLSKKRADIVKDYILSKGFKGKITSKGFGESKPIVKETSPAAKKLNRRVEFCISDDESENIEQILPTMH